MPVPPRHHHRRTVAAAVAAALGLLAAGCGAGGAGTGTAGSTTEPVVTTPTPALVARGRTLGECLAAARLGGQPAQLTPIGLRTAVVGVTITGLPVDEGARRDGGGIVWLFETGDDAEESIPDVTAAVPGMRSQYIDGAAIVILYEGADPEAVEVLERCVGQVSDPPDPPDPADPPPAAP